MHHQSNSDHGEYHYICIRKQTQDMLERDIIEPSESPWSSPIVLVKKKDNTWRYCIDCKKVSFLTRKDSKAIPDYHTDLPFVSGAKFFSTVNFQSGYWQIEADPQDKEKLHLRLQMEDYISLNFPFWSV